MEFLQFNAARCTLCGECIRQCPFSALSMGERGIEVEENCKMCGVCIKLCPEKAIHFEQKAGQVDKSEWNGILIFAEQVAGKLHPVTFELIGEARRLAEEVGYQVSAVLVGSAGTYKNAEKLLPYGVKTVFTYEHEEFRGLKTDCYTDALADCIATLKPSVVLIGGTPAGRSLAPRLSTRFHTGLTADCTSLAMKENTDLVQIRPAFGGDVMAQIVISESRPQFATVRYKVMDKAQKVSSPKGNIEVCKVTNAMVRSRVNVLDIKELSKDKSIEEEEILVVAGRGVKAQKDLDILRDLASMLGTQLCFSRPLVEKGWGDQSHQIGLSGRTVKPKLIITCGVSGAIQFASCMKDAECIVAINTDRTAPIFRTAHYCIEGDLYEVVPSLIQQIKDRKEKADA